MIFVTVGTHEQPFDRLVKYVDEMKRDADIQENVIIQTGYSTYEPKYCAWSRLLPYDQMEKHIAEARIVITHGGPASFIMPLQRGKIPIVVPRQSAFNEHVNDHQVEFVKTVAEKMRNIIPVINISNLKHIIKEYGSIIATMEIHIRNENQKFNIEFEKIVQSIFKTVPNN